MPDPTPQPDSQPLPGAKTEPGATAERSSPVPTGAALRCVLIGDVHVYRLAMAPWHLLSKRMLGQLNLWLNRRKHLRIDLLPRVVEKIASLAPDLLLCTGDLTTTALNSEFELARSMLSPLLADISTFIVPGNHDRYTFTAARTRRLEQHFTKHTTTAWPHHRQLGDRLHLVGFDPTKPTLLTAGGRVPQSQLDDFTQRILPQLDTDDRLIVMSHYPIGTPPGYHGEPPSHALANTAALVDALNLPNPVLYLHGHVHRPWCWRHPEATNVTVVNAGAPVLSGSRYPSGQGFWEIALDAEGQTPWRLVHHQMDAAQNWRISDVTIPTEPGEAAMQTE